ncbi:class I SAM-dependent methyltransferase [Bacteroidetes/Chlorobi group bacterium Naka2016]|jgi:hypothetical protein|nr:MAG: class I SAM-dependent methyltransferase [Bacteroidetes/Chlorobi group bacterium Naka2016]
MKSMKIKLFFIRKFKGLFLFLRLGYLFKIFIKPLKFLVFLVEFSLWAHKHSKIKYNDFFSFKFTPNARYLLYTFLIESEKLNNEPINYLEFGVAYGHSFKWWINHITNTESRFYGFDTFEGLPEDWNLFKKGEMSPYGQIPEINDNRASFIKGLFQDTLIPFLKNFDNTKRKVINMDADLYSSTLFTLTTLAPYLKSGDIIIFDEFGVPLHEFKAFMEFVSAFYTKYEVIAAVNNYFQVAIKIL